MRKIAMAAASLAMVGVGAAVAPSANAVTTNEAATMGAAGTPTMGTTASCPSGAVCLREPNGTILSKNIWWSYGAHNLQNVIGTKVLINNQTGGAGFKICLEYGGKDCGPVYRWTGPSEPKDFTPINSIVLVK